MYKTLVAPLSVQIEITDNCNQTCGHCYRSCQSITSSVATSMSPEQVVYVVDELAKNKVFSITFTGGEPLMCKDSLRAGIKRVFEHSIICAVNSNLQFLDNDLIDLFQKCDVKILTSLLSHKRETHDFISGIKGSHDRLLRNILRLKEAKIRTSANMVIRRDNAHQIYETGSLAHSLGVIQFSATKVAPSPGHDYNLYKATPGQIKESLDVLLQLKKDYGIKVEILESYPYCFIEDIEKYSIFAKRNCTAGVLNCSIMPDGNVKSCAHSDLTYGNVFEKPFVDCWNSMIDWRSGEYVYEGCRECEFLLKCTGGCRIDAKICYNDIKGRDPLMTNPSRVRSVKSSYQKVELSDYLIFNPEIRTRRENFGGVIRNGDDIIFLSHNGFSNVELLKNKGFFKWRDVISPGVSVEEMETFFSILCQKNIVAKRR